MINKVKTINWKRNIIAAVVVLLIEIFVWNHSFWLTSEYTPINIDEIYTETGSLLDKNNDYVIGDNSYLEIRDINQDIKNVHLDILTYKNEEKNILNVRLNMADDGNKSYYSADDKIISPLLGKCNYISIYPYGNLKSLRLTFPSERGTTIFVNNITLNQPVPMFFSVWRVVLMYVLYLVIHALFFSSYDTYYQSNPKKRRLTMVFAIFLSTAIVFPLTLQGTDADGLGTFNKYEDLTHALANGTLYVENNVDERLITAQNPYDRSERAELGIEMYRWDYAYYNGNIYVYFGVAPVILMYLPYYLITGTDLAHTVPYFIFLLGLIAGSFLFMDVFIERYCKKLPIKLYYLFQVTFMVGIGTLIFAKTVCIYNLPIMAGLNFAIWGLYFWISYSIGNKKHKTWKILLGSLCMALVAGCRPQLLLTSFLAIPIFADQLKQIRQELKEKKNIKNHILLFAAFCIPYIVVAAFLMWYNAARFDSPFEFGPTYNLTTNDVTKRGSHIARLIPGVWSYLFQLPYVNIEFPFIRATSFSSAYQGKTIRESCIGGIFSTNWILWPCFLFYYYRTKLKEKKMFLFTAISLVGALIAVVANVQMGGILTRYIVDFTVLFYLTSFMIIFTFADEYYNRKFTLAYQLSEAAWCRVIAFLCCITILYWFLSLFALYVASDYNVDNPVWYYHMKELWGLFDI